MNWSLRNVSDTLEGFQTNRLTWLWLLIGFLSLPFAASQTVIPLAAWIAPVFLLRFSRTSRQAYIALPLIFVVYVVANCIAGRGFAFTILGFLLADVFKGLLWTLPYAADRVIGSRLRGWARLFVFPLAFVVVDWGMSLLRVSSSGSPAYSQYDNLALIQILSITGMWGVTFLIMWGASTVNALWEQRFDWRALRRMVGAFAVVLLAVILFGSIRLAFVTPDSPTAQVATITSDSGINEAATSSISWTTYNQSTDAQRAAIRPKLQATVDKMLSRTETALRSGAQIVSWQEDAAWVLSEDEPSVLEQASALARQYNAYLQVSLGVLTRATSPLYLLNQSILIDNTGQIRWTYEKTHPSPYDEAFATVAGPGIMPVVDTPYGRLTTAICYDTYYPALLRQAGVNGADILFTPSNDSRMYAESAAVMGQARAIENGVALVRAAHGRTLITDYEGRVLGSQDYFTNSSGGILMTAVPTRGVTTLYGQIGDLFAYLCVFALVILSGWAFIRRERPVTIAGHLPA